MGLGEVPSTVESTAELFEAAESSALMEGALWTIRERLGWLRQRRLEHTCDKISVMRQAVYELSALAGRLGLRRLAACAARVAAPDGGGPGCAGSCMYMTRRDLDEIEVHLDSAEALWKSSRTVL